MENVAKDVSLATDSVKSLKKAMYSTLEPSFWGVQTEETLNMVRIRCEAFTEARSKYVGTSSAAWKLSFFIALCLAIAMNFLEPEPTKSVGASIALSAILGIPMFMVLRLLLALYQFFAEELLGLVDAEEVRRKLIPLSARHGKCKDALECLKESPQARTYRDTVLKSGRELRVLDLSIMEDLAYHDARQRYLDAEALACRKVHGLA